MLENQSYMNEKVVISVHTQDFDDSRIEFLGMAFTPEYQDWADANGGIPGDHVMSATLTYLMDGSATLDLFHYDRSETNLTGLGVDLEDAVESLLEEMLVAYCQ